MFAKKICILLIVFIPAIACLSAETDEAEATVVMEVLNILAPTSGICQAVYVEPDQLVQQGEQLAAIGLVGDEEMVEKLRAELLEVMKQLESSRNEYLMALQEFQRGRAVTTAVDQAWTKMEAANSTVIESRMHLRRFEDAMRPIMLYAPSDATVIEVRMVVDQSVRQDDVLFRLQVVPPQEK